MQISNFRLYTWHACLIIAAFLQHDCRSPQGAGNTNTASASSYINPVFNYDFPDPTIVKTGSTYYAYATNGSSSESVFSKLQVAKSTDLVHWTRVGDGMPIGPTWADKDFWAPHVLYDASTKLYYLYYSGESKDTSVGKCLGVATSKNPEGPFVDKGAPLLCGETFVNIDPMAFDDPVSGKKLLFWGSGFQPIKVQELSDDRLSFKQGSKPIDLVFTIQSSDPNNYQRLIEGAWVVRRGQYYYLYYSGDNCCGENAHYAVMVARSRNVLGPYETKAMATGQQNSVILEKNSRWIAPGHNSIITDNAGDDWMVYHAIDSANRTGGRVMLIDKVKYNDGWPEIETGTPSISSSPAPRANEN